MKPSSALVPLVAMVLLITPGLASAVDPLKVGGEIQVSDGVDNYAYNPRVAADPAGNFLVVWQDTENGVIKGHAFWSTGNSQGPVFQMSSALDDIYVSEGNFDSDELHDVAADKAGNFVVAYNAYDQDIGYAYYGACYGSPCIWTKRRDANGNVAPADFIVGDPRIMTYYSGQGYYNQTANPELAADGEGNFTVVWEGYDQQTSGELDEGVWGRRMVSIGQVNGSQFRVNEHTDDYQGDGGELDVAADDEGNFVVVWQDENYDVAPYGGIVFRKFDKAKNVIVQQTQVAPQGDGDDPHVASLPDGTFMVVWLADGGDVDGAVFSPAGAAVSGTFEVAANADYPEIAASAAGSFIVTFQTNDGAGVRVFDSSGTATSTVVDVDVDDEAFQPHVSAAANGDFVVTWNEGGGYTFAQRFQATVPVTEQIPLLGKVAILTNKSPDDFFKSSGKWKASGSEIVSPLRGSSSDPRCNGDPDGTVKASVRFRSATSGEDLTIGLPCQNWKTTGGNKVNAVEKRGYKYSDGKRADGPCNSVKITGTKSISVSCKGKAGAASFDYDLVVGQSQGVLQTVLQMGLFEYCAEFQPFFNGDDGKKFKGKAFAAPAACP